MEIIIQHGDVLYYPVVEEGAIWSTERAGVAGQLCFNVFTDSILKFSEGDAVRVKFKGENLFYGFIFTKKQDNSGIIKVTAYDQLRYLKNKDTYVYENKTTGDLIKMIAADFKMKTGVIENTGYRIPSRVEDNVAMFDMIQSSLDLTMQNKKSIYVLFDDFGKLTLRNVESMNLNLLIDEDTGENFDYTSSIDSNTYNKIKLVYDNEESGRREVYIAQDSKNMNSWGILQYFDTLQKNENGRAKANALLDLYNKKTKNLTIKNAFGDIRVRGGSLIAIKLNLDDVKLQNLMLVEKCKHTFKGKEHLMDLTLRGGDFIV